MRAFTTIKHLATLRMISRFIPLKHKLSFLIKKYLHDGTGLAVKYYKNWFVCTTVNDMNRSTIEEIILQGTNSQPEAALIKKLQQELPDNIVLVDVGGNIGTFFCQFLQKCQQVIVFEPIPRLNAVIKNSADFNKENKIRLIEKAVGDMPGVVKMLDNNNSNIVSDNINASVLDIHVTTLDEELQEIKKIDFIKIDVEGYELNVLNGGKKMIGLHRPRMLVEVHPVYLEQYQQHYNDIINFFEERDYKIRYFSFLVEQRMSKLKRIFSRWFGNKGEEFIHKSDFINDLLKKPPLLSYHFYCEPG